MNTKTKTLTPTKARYLMVGGFLGAGKTTAIGRLARFLTGRGLSVGLITNDQAGGLVDTRLLRGQGFATEEIAGGCFCCRFDSLMDAARKLEGQSKPDVIIAEPVGSCTDLVATVTYPLRRLYGEAFTIAPLSVLIDPVRARRIFGLDAGGSFSSKVLYIFKKQLEEADLIVIHKSDLITAGQTAELRGVLARNFPKARILAASTRHELGLDDWFQHLLDSEQNDRHALMTLDYEVYADGEALLGWLNATLLLQGEDEFDADALLFSFIGDLQTRLLTAGAEIAHLKMTFSPDDSLASELASVQLVRSDASPEPGMTLDEPVESGQLIVNLRAEADPNTLIAALNESLDALRAAHPGIVVTLEHEEHFRPGKPEPTYRDGVEIPGTASPACTPEARARSVALGRPCC